MAISFKKLKNNPNDRTVRQVIMSGSQSIRVFEPSPQDIDTILNAQESWVSVEEGVNVSEEDVLKKLIPLLTDIEGIEDMSDEEIREVISNPSIALLSVQSEIESIIVEIYRHITILARRQLQDADYELETMLTQQESFDRTISMASKYGDDQEIPRKLQEAVNNLTSAYKDKDAQGKVGMNDVVKAQEELKEFMSKEDKDNVVSLSSALESAKRSEQAINNDLDLGEPIKQNSVEAEDSGDVYTSDKSKNLTKMVEEKKKLFKSGGITGMKLE